MSKPLSKFREAEKKYRVQPFEDKKGKKRRKIQTQSNSSSSSSSSETDEADLDPIRQLQTQFPEIIDFSALESNSQENLDNNIVHIDMNQERDGNVDRIIDGVGDGKTPVGEWKVYGLKCAPGFRFIVNPFSKKQQREWVSTCLTEYTLAPNNTNLHAIYQVPDDLWAQAHQGTKEKKEINGKRKHDSVQEGEVAEVDVYNSDMSSSTFGNVDGKKKTADPDVLLRKLRWSSLGYQYDWTMRVYHEAYREEFPEPLNKLCGDIVHSMGYDEEYRAEAAIINFSHTNSRMSGHKDDAEYSDAPIMSVSFGHSAIFLVGGDTVDSCVPQPIVIHSGDIVMLAGQTRFAVHGVPLIVQDTLVPWLSVDAELEEEEDARKWNSIGKWMSNSRVNLNVRQVLPDGLDVIPEFSSRSDEAKGLHLYTERK
eukprot:TRINITY_DN1212_c0_g1_i2.p1 TRINITY_DN1212_c0_g1~~TRINITY_DN1212_c0_g1_i2.p1  ORF type:complete len:424 (-),score=129.29 TRINITY_DN1212_c0_g1_i2:1220-2491(-)